MARNLVLISSSAPFGPGEEFLLVEAEALAQLDFHVYLLPVLKRRRAQRTMPARSKLQVIDAGLGGLSVIQGFLLHVLEKPIRIWLALRLAWTWSFPHLLRNLLIIPKAVWLARFVRERNIDHIHAYWASTPAMVAMIAGAISSTSWSMSAHRGDIVGNNRLCDKISQAEFTRFISRHGLSLAAHCGELSGEKLRLLHIGVNIPALNPEPKSIRDDFIVLCPASLSLLKGQQVLVEALSRFGHTRDVQVWFAGEGDMRDSLESLVMQLGLTGQVRFLGQLPHDDLLDLYASRQVDIVVLSSLDLGNGQHEGIPVSLMEAMSYQIPVISTNTGGIPELFAGDAGILVAPGNVEELFGAIVSLRDDPMLRRALGEQGRIKVEADFNSRKNVARLGEWIESTFAA